MCYMLFFLNNLTNNLYFYNKNCLISNEFMCLYGLHAGLCIKRRPNSKNIYIYNQTLEKNPIRF